MQNGFDWWFADGTILRERPSQERTRDVPDVQGHSRSRCRGGMNARRPTLSLKKKESEPLIVSHGRRRAIVKPVKRKERYLCIVMGRRHHGPTKIHTSLKKARLEAGRIVAQAKESHCFVVHIIESAKFYEKQKGVQSEIANRSDANGSRSMALGPQER